VEDGELVSRAVRNYGEMLATVARCGLGPHAEVRRPDAVGAAMGHLERNPWLDAVVVPADAVAPADDPLLPYCVWALDARMSGRVEDTAIAMPCMGLDLVASTTPTPRRTAGDGPVVLTSPPPGVVGDVNDRAYGGPPWFGPLAARLDDDRLRTVGLEVDGVLACVAVTLTLGDDLGIHYVATDAGHRRRGLATRMLDEALARAAADGLRTATLQASPDGRPVYRRMGFREVGLLRAFVRP
jgi:ribosomal protein S18 acetylase RimI-like enzyme